MEFYPVPARLRTNYNDITTYGLVRVMGSENAVEFIADFVPLIPLGEPAAVDWVYGDRSLVSFLGTVYLSSPGLLRLVNVSSELVEAARATFAVNAHLPGLVTVKQGKKRALSYPAEVLYLSAADSVTLLCKNEIQPDQTVWLSAEVDFLTLKDLPLHVRRRVPLRKDEELLLCDVQGYQNDENFVALSSYSARLEQWK